MSSLERPDLAPYAAKSHLSRGRKYAEDFKGLPNLRNLDSAKEITEGATFSDSILAFIQVEESDEERKGVILDYDEKGDVVSLEILDAKNRVTKPTEMVYELAGQAGLATVA